MLIIGFDGIGIEQLIEKYPEYVIKLDFNVTEITNDGLISYIERIKECQNKYDIVFIPYVNEVVLCLDTLAISIVVVYPTEMDKERITDLGKYNLFKTLALKHESLVLKIGETLEQSLVNKFSWIKINDEEENQVENKKESQEANKEANSEISQENKEENQLVEKECVDDKPVVNKNKLTLKELVENDLEITEADVRELKSETNRFKVAMLLQAKSRLSMVLKLCDVLDKLYAELVDRIDLSLKTTDTPSLMFTADYVSKALSDTNQFIMSLITNEKIQNFFIIDNSNVINITENRVDIDKREKIRKAAEIVIENVDYFSEGQYDKLVNPNAVEVEKGVDTDANLSAKSVSSE